MKESPPLIFDVHRFALDDGPGIRTTVFMKGCPLSCLWCQNPQSIGVEREIGVHPDRCIRCGLCTAVCPEAAIAFNPALQVDRNRCTSCGNCVDNCPARAIRMIGKEYPLDDLMEILRRDRHFFDSSGGGVTFSGGEPTLWMNYLGAALAKLKSENIHTAIQTCGMFDYDSFSRKLLPFIDLILFDLKFIDGSLHKKYTGQDNATILANFRRLTREARSKVNPRVPLIPGITAVPDNLLKIASFIAELGYLRCDLLPYNLAGIETRRAMGVELQLQLPGSPLEEDDLRKLFLERLTQRLDTAA